MYYLKKRTPKMIIRRASKSDYDHIWDIFSEVIKTGDTYVFNPNTPKAALEKHWLADYMTTFVAEESGQIVGTYIIKPAVSDLQSETSIKVGFVISAPMRPDTIKPT